MIQIENELFNLYSSLEKLESLDRFYYKDINFNLKENRLKLRCDIINSLKVDLFNNASNTIYKYNQRELNTLPIYDKLYDRVGCLDVITTYRYIDSYRKKTIRLKKRISNILEYDNIFFLTFTFDDKKLKKGINGTKKNVLRKYVCQWLKKYCYDYVGNIDFGGQKGRLHFHCVVSSIDIRINGKSWKYGALNFEKITNKNNKAISLYVNKLCSHALKESTKNQYLIYPKKILTTSHN